MIKFLVSSNYKGKTYNLILVIVNQLTKIVYYKPVKITINATNLVNIIINIVVHHYGLLDLIISDCSLVFTSKFWLSLYYFLGIKWRLSTTFYPQKNGQTKRQNSTINTYL